MISPYLRINQNAYLIRMRIWRLRNLRAANPPEARKSVDEFICIMIRRHWPHRHDQEIYSPSTRLPE